MKNNKNVFIFVLTKQSMHLEKALYCFVRTKQYRAFLSKEYF